MSKSHQIGRRMSRPPTVDTVPKQPRTLHDLLALHERSIIILAITRNGFSRTKAAMSLGITTGYLWRRMKLLKIETTNLPVIRSGRPRKKFS